MDLESLTSDKWHSFVCTVICLFNYLLMDTKDLSDERDLISEETLPNHLRACNLAWVFLFLFFLVCKCNYLMVLEIYEKQNKTLE